jgi:hypothetical protein
MPYRRLPNSVPAVLRTLNTAGDTYKNTANPAERAISAEQFAKLDDTAAPPSLLKRFAKEASDVDIAQAAQSPLTTDLAQKAAALTMAVSHFHQVLDLAITRGTFQAGARSYYGRDVSAASIPDLSNYDAVKEAAEKIVSGEAARQSAEGAAYKAMALPSAAEIGALLTGFLTTRDAAQRAQTYTDQQSEELQALYPEAHELAVDICETVEFFYRKDLNDGSRRTKCQRWGVVYIYDTTAQTTPTSTPTPPPAPTP